MTQGQQEQSAVTFKRNGLTVECFFSESGRLAKKTVRDSFGVQQTDNFPALFMPVGLADGLTDPKTGLIRFGYREVA